VPALPTGNVEHTFVKLLHTFAPQAARWLPVHSTHTPALAPAEVSQTPSVFAPLTICPQWLLAGVLPLAALFTQATHWLATQREAPAVLQSVSATHWTQVLVAVLQARPRGLPVQSVLARHSTQRPLLPPVQACLPAMALQSAFARQLAHRPVASQRDLLGSATQSPLPVHCTHSPLLQMFFGPNLPVHWVELWQAAQA